MNTLTTSRQTALSDPEVDHGLRSVQGIRWLLLAGGLVVAVSVIRLIAAGWGELAPTVRFLTVALGAVAVFAAGDVTWRRLRLPVAGSALLFLGVTLVPLLAWGAAYLRLLDEPFGWPGLILGLTPLLVCADRVLRATLGFRGGAYTAASGVMLFALPVTPYLEARWPWSAETFFLGAATALGLLLRGASRHVNRFFFHRDRFAGVERPVHWLPFASLILFYGASVSLMSAFDGLLAVPLAFVALALIDAGEEYYRALVRSTGEKPVRWPARSRGLLALGFALLTAAVVTTPLDAGGHSLALVTSIASLRLLAWAWRYASTAAHVAGLLASIVAYHAMPVFAPEAVRELFRRAVAALGVYSDGVGALSIGDLGMVAQLLALGWLMRGRLTPAMRRAHGLITAGFASLVLFISLIEPDAGRWVAPATALLLGAGLIVLRWRILVPVFFLALVFWVPHVADVIAGGSVAATTAGWLALAVVARAAAGELERRGHGDLASTFLNAAVVQGAFAGFASIVATLDGGRSPWLQILPGFLASALFAFLSAERRRAGARTLLAALATALFAGSSSALVTRIDIWGPEVYCLGPGLALLALSGLLRRELGGVWRQRLFTAGATLLYAMPVMGLLDELTWGWQIVLLLFAVAFGAASFRLRSRPLLITSTAALVVDLACFLIKLRQTAPLLVWVAGIVFGLGLMAAAALLEHRREVLLQRIRIWGRELRSWA